MTTLVVVTVDSTSRKKVGVCAGRIAKVFSLIVEPEPHASEVIAWLEGSKNGTSLRHTVSPPDADGINPIT